MSMKWETQNKLAHDKLDQCKADKSKLQHVLPFGILSPVSFLVRGEVRT